MGLSMDQQQGSNEELMSAMETDQKIPSAPFVLGMSIKHKIMLHVIVVISIAIAASTYIAVVTESSAFHKSLVQKGQNIARNIASSTKSAFWSLNWIFVENVLHDSSNGLQNDIIYIKIIKPNGEVYLANDQKYYGQQVDRVLLPKNEKVIEDHAFLEENIQSGFLVIHPVSIGKDTWHILLGLSTAPIDVALKNLIYKNIAWGSIFILLSVVVSFFLSRSITKPIIDLAETTKAFSDGRRNQQINVTGRDEVGLLGHSFAKMIESIETAENALIASNERFVTVLDSIDATIYVADIDTHEVLFMNQAIKDVFGTNREGELCYKVFRGEDTPCDHCTNGELVDADGNPTSGTMWEGYNPLVQRWYVNYDRAIRWINDSIVRIQIAFDTSKIKQLENERQLAEARLRQSQKMEAIGKLAGGVAHDLNNILSGIVSYPDILLMGMPTDHPMRRPIETIQSSGKRASTIVNDLLTLARRGVAISKVVDLNKLILDHVNSPEHDKMMSFHQRVAIELSLDEDLAYIKGSPVHLSKTLMNLISNAAEAMPDGGRIHISTGHKPVGAIGAAHTNNTMEPHVFLKVSDDGVGMTAEEQEKIFEPFYTKKVMGRSGTGLGMAVVWGTVQDHSGCIDVHSEVGKGTTFLLSFPATDQQLIGPEANTDMSQLGGNGETILLVDDVEEQREIGSLMLKRLNYQVEVVDSGEAAIDYMMEHDVDLMVLDMIMKPGISGLETYRRILEFKPNQRAIIASGYSETEDVKTAQKLGAGGYLKKPYSLEEIAKIVRGELSQNR